MGGSVQLSEDEVVRVLATRDWWTEIRCVEGGNVLFGEPDDDWNRDVDEHKKHGTCGFPAHKHREPLPDYLHSHDALRPVLVKLAAEEWVSLRSILQRECAGLVPYPLLYEQWLLTLDRPVLARAVAEAVVACRKEGV